MKIILRDDESGVSEVIGTILILAMTVVLFSSIILWVGSIPTPTTQTRVDIRPTLTPLKDGTGNEIGVNITLLHRGVEPLPPAPTVIYVTAQRGTNPPSTDKVILHKYDPLLGTPSGILDGADIVWDIGERWAYENFLLRSTDQITVTVIDIFKNNVVWTAQITAPAGTRPPVFIAKWADDTSGTATVDPVQATLGFVLYARVVDPDNDLNRNSVFATLTIFFGTVGPCVAPLKMHDDGIFPDVAAGDDMFSLGANGCMDSPNPALNWDGSLVLVNATDLQGHQTNTRLRLTVIPRTGDGGGGGGIFALLLADQSTTA
ncbi:MAG: type IV pilin N-terminal domain-containing protein, partial [Thermoplasmata archaeon]